MKKMPSIQSVSIASRIEMKSMKVIDTMQNMMNQEFQHDKQSQHLMILRNCEPRGDAELSLKSLLKS
jgi:hypothetical protein